MNVVWLAAVGGCVLAYELVRSRLRRRTVWPASRRAAWYAGCTLLAVVGEPPLASAAHRVLWAQTLQFCLLAFAATPLAVLGAAPARPADRALETWAALRTARNGTAVAFGGFLVATIGWRTPAAVDAVTTGRGWLALEAVTVLAASWWLWTVLFGLSVAAPWVQQRLRRLALATTAAWSVWIFAYVVGFGQHPFYPAFASGRSPMAMQELAVGVLWGVSALALCPVMFVNLIRWLATDRAEAEAEMRRHRAPAWGVRGDRV